MTRKSTDTGGKSAPTEPVNEPVNSGAVKAPSAPKTSTATTPPTPATSAPTKSQDEVLSGAVRDKSEEGKGEKALTF